MLRNFLKRFRRNQRGVAAVEFALVAPLFAVLGVCTADIGFAAAARMDMDQSMRSAAQISLSANIKDVAQLKKAVEQAFSGKSPAPTVTAASTCECPGSSSSVDCYQACDSAGNAPSIFVDLNMTKSHNAMMLPDMTLNSKLTVRLR